MQQLEFFQIPSPCVGVCSVDDKGYCQGCMRKREERFTWLQMTPAQQRHVLKLCRQRYRKKMLAGSASTKEISEEAQNPQQNLF